MKKLNGIPARTREEVRQAVREMIRNSPINPGRIEAMIIERETRNDARN